MDVKDQLIKPGINIKPQVTLKDVTRMLLSLYGINSREISELNAYDDKNYLVHVDRTTEQEDQLIFKNTSSNCFVLKILNKFDSQKYEFIEAQIELIVFLANKQLKVPIIIKNLHGDYYSTETLAECQHVVRLFEFIPGKILAQITPSDNLYFQCGEYLGEMTSAMQNFSHSGFDTHKTIWMLNFVPELKSFLYAVKDEEKLEIFKAAIEQFEKIVIPKLDLLAKGTIHGDYNEQNIVVSPCTSVSSHSEYRLAGVLDFGDANYSCLIFDLAIAMTYMMLHSGNLATGGLVLAGYRTMRTVPSDEMKILKVCVAARLCQSLVMGLYTQTLNPENEYILSSQKPGWEMLKQVWSQKDDFLIDLWQSTADVYSSQSIK